MTDPPVVAVDEAGHFCIPLLSGHVEVQMSWLKEWRAGFREYRS